MKQNNKQHILARYGLIIGLFLFLAIVITIRLLYTCIIDANRWNENALKALAVETRVLPERGNILADNGNILACNLLVYDIKLDLQHEAIVNKKITYNKSIDSLADSLDRYYPMVDNFEQLTSEEKIKKSWHTRLKKQFSRKVTDRNRAIYIKKKGSLEDFERIKNFPFLKRFAKKKGNYNPLYRDDKHIRVYPFGKMAELSIGRVNYDTLTKSYHGYSGLERDLDSLLYGVDGKSQKIPLTTGMTDWIITQPKRGYDVHTTINIDMQDMLEEELKRVCIDSKASWGTALLMERKTGNIKAISNLEKLPDGTYGEALNRAVLAYEPGSVMKAISLMIAFEDGLVNSVNDVVDTSPFQQTTDKHAPPVKNMKQVIEKSSNTGIARVIFRKYSKNPLEWHDRLKSIGFFEPFHTGIHEERIPYVPRLTPVDAKGNNVTMTARHLSLARQTYGYNTMIPPLYTLAYYNAIANEGILVYPRLIQSLRSEDGRDSVLKPKQRRICSAETARKVSECVREVVISKSGTGHILEDDRVAIAGKTGTAFPLSHGVYDMSYRRLAFAGYFPYENPKYTMMVLILAPAGNGAARTSGMVIKNMALRLYSRGMLDNVSTYNTERFDSQPTFVASQDVNYSKLRNKLNISSIKQFKQTNSKPGIIPDLRGYDPKAAVEILERLGVNVKLVGAGYVIEQSIPAGTKAVKGSSITLKLKV